jgi:glutamine amidotransferase
LGFYFVHSYYFEASNVNNILATTDYGDKFTSAVINENIYGVQFHPEKSHTNGIQLLSNFSRL